MSNSSATVPKTIPLALLLAALCAACSAQPTALAPTPTTVPATAAPTTVPVPTIAVVGTDITQALPPGDADRGFVVALQFECTTCHNAADANSPSWEAGAGNQNKGIATTAETEYLADDYTGHATSAQEYLFEGIVDPRAYFQRIGTNTGVGAPLMPKDYGSRLTQQELADLIAYLETFK